MKRTDFEMLLVVVTAVLIVGVPILVFTNLEFAVGFVTGVVDAIRDVLFTVRSTIFQTWRWFWSF